MHRRDIFQFHDGTNERLANDLRVEENKLYFNSTMVQMKAPFVCCEFFAPPNFNSTMVQMKVL